MNLRNLKESEGGSEFVHRIILQEREVFAGREILLSAGAINSPQILMLSGVGPAQHLQEHKVRGSVSLTPTVS